MPGYSADMPMRVLRKRNRTKSQNRPVPPLAPELGLALRRAGALGSGVHARYPVGVAERKINRDAWARLVDSLVNTETRGKKATFARLVGVDPRTVSRWLNSEVDVSEESVREVARNLNRPPMELLVKVGYYSQADIPTITPRESSDPAIEEILAAPVTERQKAKMIERLQVMREAHREREVDEVRWWIDQQRGA